jgi:Tfp pilus assembly protein PilF
MSEKSIVGEISDEILGASTPAGADWKQTMQEQRDILEAGIRLALSALAQGDPDTAQSQLTDALQRASTSTAGRPVSEIGPLP